MKGSHRIKKLYRGAGRGYGGGGRIYPYFYVAFSVQFFFLSRILPLI